MGVALPQNISWKQTKFIQNKGIPYLKALVHPSEPLQCRNNHADTVAIPNPAHSRSHGQFMMMCNHVKIPVCVGYTKTRNGEMRNMKLEMRKWKWSALLLQWVGSGLL